MINHLNKATSILCSDNIAILFADGRRQSADDFDVDCILCVVLAAFTNLELHLVTPTTATATQQLAY